MFENLSTASCTGTILRGTRKTVAMNLPTVGTPPYVYRFFVDGIWKADSAAINNTSFSFDYTFNESSGNHTYRGEVHDNCGKGDYSECIINVIECPNPVLVMTI